MAPGHSGSSFGTPYCRLASHLSRWGSNSFSRTVAGQSRLRGQALLEGLLKELLDRGLQEPGEAGEVASGMDVPGIDPHLDLEPGAEQLRGGAVGGPLDPLDPLAELRGGVGDPLLEVGAGVVPGL